MTTKNKKKKTRNNIQHTTSQTIIFPRRKYITSTFYFPFNYNHEETFSRMHVFRSLWSKTIKY